MDDTTMAVKKVQDDLMDEIGRQIAKEIDDGIMSTMLVESSWTPVNFIYQNRYHAVDVDFWLEDNCKGKWCRYNSDYLFKDKQDAEWFILRWL